MTVLRIVPNIAVADPAAASQFYETLFGLEQVMDHGWILSLAADTRARPQLSLASQGGSGTPVPNISIEVDDVDATHQRAREAGIHIIYPLTDEPWGVRRFQVRDPAGTLLNILSHRGDA